MKELKSKAWSAPRKARKTKASTSKVAGCHCSCKCSDESAYSDAASLAQDSATDGSPHCGCNYSQNTLDYAMDMA